MTEYETPLMRDISKALPGIMIGIILGLAVFTITFARFNAEYHGNGCIITTTWTVPRYVMQMITGC